MPFADFLPFLISASLGALIGMERQWEDQQKEGHPARAGLRTFVLWALLGTTSAYLSDNHAPQFFVFGFVAMIVMLVLNVVISQPDRPPLGLTTMTSAILTFLVGGMVQWGEIRLALVLSVSMILLLAGKGPIHHLGRKFTAEDFRLALQFLAITCIVLPLAPNVNYGPYDALNPHTIWLMVVLVTGLGFAGYVAMRLFGTNAGLGTIGILGGLVSSTATTLAFSRESRQNPRLSHTLAIAIVLACTIMLGRVAILVGTINRDVLDHLWIPLVAMALPGLAFAGYALWRGRKSKATATSPDLKNPLSLRIAVIFALAYAAIVLLARAGAAHFGNAGITVVSFLSGLTDMDAIALSLGNMAQQGQIDPLAAARGITVGAVSNTILKAGAAVVLGSREIRRPILGVFGLTIAVGATAWVLLGV